MGISRSLPIPTTAPVLPGTSVQQSVYTDKGFTAGDYVYRYNGNSVGSYPYFTTALPGVTITTIIAGTKYNISYGTASPFNRSSMTAPTTVPSTYSVTFPASTSLGSTFLAQQNVSTYVTNYGPRCALLTNGTIVVLYQSASNTLSYNIYNTSGTVLYSGNVATGITFSGWGNSKEGCFDVCGLNSGGFAVAYHEGGTGQFYLVTYSSTGTVILGPQLSSPSGPFIGALCADTSDILYTIGTSGGTGAGNQTYVTRYTSALAVSSNSGGIAANYYAAPKITYTISGHLGLCVDTTNLAYWLYSPSALTAIASTNGSMGKGQNARMSICASLEVNGGAFFATTYLGSLNLAYSYASPSASSIQSSSSSIAFSSAYGMSALIPAYVTTAGVNDGTTNGFFAFFPATTGQNTVAVLIGNLSSNRASFTYSSRVTTAYVNSSNAADGTCAYACPTGTASAFVVGINNSGYNSVGLYGTFTYASTSSISTPSALQPNVSVGYSLIGVAASTAAAGSYGNIVINGNASLSSSYGTSSTVYGFNYNPLNSYGFQGNIGYVVNRVVTLEGLE